MREHILSQILLACAASPVFYSVLTQRTPNRRSCKLQERILQLKTH